MGFVWIWLVLVVVLVHWFILNKVMFPADNLIFTGIR